MSPHKFSASDPPADIFVRSHLKSPYPPPWYLSNISLCLIPPYPDPSTSTSNTSVPDPSLCMISQYWNLLSDIRVYQNHPLILFLRTQVPFPDVRVPDPFMVSEYQISFSNTWSFSLISHTRSLSLLSDSFIWFLNTRSLSLWYLSIRSFSLTSQNMIPSSNTSVLYTTHSLWYLSTWYFFLISEYQISLFFSLWYLSTRTLPLISEYQLYWQYQQYSIPNPVLDPQYLSIRY